MTNKERFLALATDDDGSTIEQVNFRVANREMLKESQKVALKVLLKLDELGWFQTDLAKEMNVKPQQITKIVSGKENLTLETLKKLQTILDIPLLASYFEGKIKDKELELNFSGSAKFKDEIVNYPTIYEGHEKKLSFIKLSWDKDAGEYEHNYDTEKIAI